MGKIAEQWHRFEATMERGIWEPPPGYAVDGIPCSCMELIDGEHDAQCAVARELWIWDEVDLAYDLMED